MKEDIEMEERIIAALPTKAQTCHKNNGNSKGSRSRKLLNHVLW